MTRDRAITLVAILVLALLVLTYWWYSGESIKESTPLPPPRRESPILIDFNAMSRDTLEFDRQIRALNPLYR